MCSEKTSKWENVSLLPCTKYPKSVNNCIHISKPVKFFYALFYL